MDKGRDGTGGHSFGAVKVLSRPNHVPSQQHAAPPNGPIGCVPAQCSSAACTVSGGQPGRVSFGESNKVQWSAPGSARRDNKKASISNMDTAAYNKLMGYLQSSYREILNVVNVELDGLNASTANYKLRAFEVRIEATRVDELRYLEVLVFRSEKDQSCMAMLPNGSCARKLRETVAMLNPSSKLSSPLLHVWGLRRLNKHGEYLCYLCEQRFPTVELCRDHCFLKEHRQKLQLRRLGVLARNVPPPIGNHARALDLCVQSEAAKWGQSKGERQLVEQLVDTISSSLVQKDPTVFAGGRLYGSRHTGTALKTSNINIELLLVGDAGIAVALLRAFEILSESLDGDCVEKVFNDKYPHIKVNCDTFDMPQLAGVHAVISVKNDIAYKTSCVIQRCVRECSLFAPLCHLARKFARVCLIDDWHTGGLPPYAFDILLIHFLQSKRVMPNIDVKAACEETVQSECAFDGPADLTNAGPLWAEFLSFCSSFADGDYIARVATVDSSLPVRRDDRKWARRCTFAVEDPHMTNKNVSQMSRQTTDFLSQCFQRACIYFGVPRSADGPLYELKLSNDGRDDVPEPEGEESVSNESVDSPLSDAEQSAAELECASHRDSDDGGSDKSDLLADIQSEVHESCTPEAAPRVYSISDLRAILQKATDQGALENRTIVDKIPAELRTDSSGFNKTLLDKRVKERPPVVPDTRTSEHLFSTTGPVHLYTQNGVQLTADAYRQLLGSVNAEECVFELDRGDIFTEKQKPPPHCVECRQSGHVPADCPEHQLQPLDGAVPLESCGRPIPKSDGDQLDVLIVNCVQWRAMPLARHHLNENIRNHLHQLIARRRVFGNRKFRLSLFGSAVNGLGFDDSDIDLCLTLDGHDELPPEYEQESCIMAVAHAIRCDNSCVGNVEAITSAKVPIVRFTYFMPQCSFEADISLYNRLAVTNSRLVGTYAKASLSLQLLARLCKLWAKTANIGDASRGALSSYAYTLMAIHYLQQCRPPVLPVLQEVRRPADVQRWQVDGWDTYFCDKPQVVAELMNKLGEDKIRCKHPHALWMGFLHYYTEVFDYTTHVIQIRQSKPLTKLEKLWVDKPMNIEDPFDLNHNLASGLSRRMYRHIRCSLIRARNTVLNKSFQSDMGLPAAVDSFLRDSRLEANPPADRVCRYCRGVGHYIDRCPKRRARQEATQQARLRQQQRQRDVPERRPADPPKTPLASGSDKSSPAKCAAATTGVAECGTSKPPVVAKGSPAANTKPDSPRPLEPATQTANRSTPEPAPSRAPVPSTAPARAAKNGRRKNERQVPQSARKQDRNRQRKVISPAAVEAIQRHCTPQTSTAASVAPAAEQRVEIENHLKAMLNLSNSPASSPVKPL